MRAGFYDLAGVSLRGGLLIRLALRRFTHTSLKGCTLHLGLLNQTGGVPTYIRLLILLHGLNVQRRSSMLRLTGQQILPNGRIVLRSRLFLGKSGLIQRALVVLNRANCVFLRFNSFRQAFLRHFVRFNGLIIITLCRVNRNFRVIVCALNEIFLGALNVDLFTGVATGTFRLIRVIKGVTRHERVRIRLPFRVGRLGAREIVLLLRLLVKDGATAQAGHRGDSDGGWGWGGFSRVVGYCVLCFLSFILCFLPFVLLRLPPLPQAPLFARLLLANRLALQFLVFINCVDRHNTFAISANGRRRGLTLDKVLNGVLRRLLRYAAPNVLRRLQCFS